MKILFITYEPITLRHGEVRTVAILKALSDAGYQVDLVAPAMDSLPHSEVQLLTNGVADRRFRRMRLRWAALRAAGSGGYDAVLAVDDAVFFANRLCRIKRIPLVYDAVRRFTGVSGSGIPRRYRFFPTRFRRMEKRVLGHAVVVLSSSPALSDDLLMLNRDARIVLLEDVPAQSLRTAADPDFAALTAQFALRPLAKVLCCAVPAGSANLRDLMMAARKIVESAPNTGFIFKDVPVEAAQKMAANLDIAGHCVLLPPDDPDLFFCALEHVDVVLMVPERKRRYIHPMVYTLLNTPAALVVTPSPAYDALLTDKAALRVLSSPEGMAEGILRVIQEPLFSVGIAAAGQQLVSSGHSFASFKHQVRMIFRELFSTN